MISVTAVYDMCLLTAIGISTGGSITVHIYTNTIHKGKGKAGPDGSRNLRLPDFVTTAQDGGGMSTSRTGLLYPPVNAPGTHFC